MTERDELARDLFMKWTSNNIGAHLLRLEDGGGVDRLKLKGCESLAIACFEVADAFFKHVPERGNNYD